MLSWAAVLPGCLDGGGGSSTQGGRPATTQTVGPALPLPTATTSYYVSATTGDDAWSGMLPAPNATATDGPKASLDAAEDLLNGAAPGTHVLLKRGDEWQASTGFVVDDAIGTSTDPIVLGAYGTGAQPRIVAQHPVAVITVRGTVSEATRHFWVRDLFLTGVTPAASQSGVFVGEAAHPNLPRDVTLSKLTIERVGEGLVLFGDGHLVHGSRIAHNGLGHGIYTFGSGVRIVYNELENNGPPPPDAFIHSVTIVNSDGLVFENNEVHSATDGLKVRRCDDCSFRYNSIHDIEAIGIHLGGDSTGGAYDNRIEGNVFFNNASDIVIKSESGIQVDPVDGLVIANNVMDSGTIGFIDFGAHLVLTSVPARNVAVVNNLIFETGSDDGIRIVNGGPNISCHNNIVAQLAGGATYALDPAVIESDNLEFGTMTAFETLALEDVQAFDFKTTAASTALIDQGVDVSLWVSSDIEGDPRPRGAGFDIGPYEYAP